MVASTPLPEAWVSSSLDFILENHHLLRLFRFARKRCRMKSRREAAKMAGTIREMTTVAPVGRPPPSVLLPLEELPPLPSGPPVPPLTASVEAADAVFPALGSPESMFRLGVGCETVLAVSPWMLSVAEGSLFEIIALVLAVVSLGVIIPEERVEESKAVPSILPVPEDSITLEKKMNVFIGESESLLAKETTEVAPVRLPDAVAPILVLLSLPPPADTLPVLARLPPPEPPGLPLTVLSEMSLTPLTGTMFPELESEPFVLSELESVFPELFEFPELESFEAESLLSVALAAKVDTVVVTVTVEAPSSWLIPATSRVTIGLTMGISGRDTGRLIKAGVRCMSE